MKNFSDRLLYIISNRGITKSKAAETLGVSGAFISQLCGGTRIPSDRTITDICREFGVDEVWLRTGEGEPFADESREEQILRFATQTVRGSDEFRKAFVSMLAKLDAQDWENLAKIYAKATEHYKKSE